MSNLVFENNVLQNRDADKCTSDKNEFTLNRHLKNDSSNQYHNNIRHYNHSGIQTTTSTSTPPSTILITSNYSQRDPNLVPVLSNQKNSITILTNNNHANEINSHGNAAMSTNQIAIDAPSTAFVLDRINICINNHYNNEMSPPVNHATMVPQPLANGRPEFNQLLVNGQDVLVHREDSRFYLGTIVIKSETQCLVKFDDSTRYWASFKQLKPLNSNSDDNPPMCVLCKKLDTNDEIEECERCCRGYHRKCKKKDSINGEDWYCRICAHPKKLSFDKEKESCDKNVICSLESQLPYNINSLHWDVKHRVNEEQIYCYCGRNGRWDNKMIQCCKCQQWFHSACLSCTKYPIYPGDRFYVFCCSICNDGSEFLRRLEMKWVDILHLILFNLTKSNSWRKYHHFKKHILHFACKNWSTLQVPLKMRNLSEDEIKDNIKKTLSQFISRFQSGKEIKKNFSFWGLRTVLPPPSPIAVFSQDVQLSDHYLIKNTNFKFISAEHPAESPGDFHNYMSKSGSLPLRDVDSSKQVGKDTSNCDFDKSKSTSTSPVKSDNNVANGKMVDSKSNLEMPINSGNRVKSRRKQNGIRQYSALSIDQQLPMLNSSSFTILNRLIPTPNNFIGENNPFRIVTPKKRKTICKKIGKNNSGRFTSVSKKAAADLSTKLAALRKSDLFQSSSMKNSMTAGQLISSTEAAKNNPKRRLSKSNSITAEANESERMSANRHSLLSEKLKSSNPHGRLLRQRPDRSSIANRKSNGDTSSNASKSNLGLSETRTSEMDLQKDRVSAAMRIANGQTYKVIGKRKLSNGQIQYQLEWDT